MNPISISVKEGSIVLINRLYYILRNNSLDESSSISV